MIIKSNFLLKSIRLHALLDWKKSISLSHTTFNPSLFSIIPHYVLMSSCSHVLMFILCRCSRPYPSRQSRTLYSCTHVLCSFCASVPGHIPAGSQGLCTHVIMYSCSFCAGVPGHIPAGSQGLCTHVLMYYVHFVQVFQAISQQAVKDYVLM